MHPLNVQPLQKIIRSFGMEKALSKEKNEDLSNFHVRHDIQVWFFASLVKRGMKRNSDMV
jgi:hypothetical protein